MEEQENQIPGQGLGKETYNVEGANPSPDEKGSSDIDINQRDAGADTPDNEEKKKKTPTAPSGDMIVNTGADIGSKGSTADGDAASG